MRLDSPDQNEVAAARAGDPAAREALIKRSLPHVIQWCGRLGGPGVDPEDASHDVMVVLLTRLPTLHDTERFPSWLFGVTRRVLAAHRRRAWLRRWAPFFGPDRADDAPGPESMTRMSEVSLRVQAALEAISVDHREALVLADIEERTETEIAEILQLPIGTVRARIRRARAAFLRVAPRTGLTAVVFENTGDGE